jgi:hypothetical protein
MLKLKKADQNVEMPRDLPMPKYEYQAAAMESCSYTHAEYGMRGNLGPVDARAEAISLLGAVLKI